MKVKLSLIVAGVALAGVMSVLLPTAFAQQTTPPAATPPSTMPTDSHPAMHRALFALVAAKKEMLAANHDYGGHREEAIKACEKAIEQLQLCLRSADK